MKKDNTTLKSYFETGDYPTEAQFADLIDSFLNVEEKDAVIGIIDNGDSTYTFQLLSGNSVTVNARDIPADIPIANIVGLQAALDVRDPNDFVKKGVDESNAMNNEYLIFNYADANNVDAVSYNDATNSYYFNADVAKSNTSANAGIFGGTFYINDTNTKISKGGSNSLKLDTPTGYIEIGSKNSSHCHFYTDRSNFYFSKELRVDTGKIGSYDEDLDLNRAGSSTARLRVTSNYCVSDQNFLIYGRSAQALSIRGSSNNANTPCYIRFEKQDGSDRGYLGYGSNSHSNLILANSEGTDCNLQLKTNGEAEFNNNVRADNFILSSDERLKTKIKPVEKIFEIDFVEFELKKSEGDLRYGVIAQKVEEKSPELVYTDEEGMKQVKYIDLLCAKMAEKDKQIVKIENELEELKKIIGSLVE